MLDSTIKFISPMFTLIREVFVAVFSFLIITLILVIGNINYDESILKILMDLLK